jgi:CRP-like cAMP-binding protein
MRAEWSTSPSGEAILARAENHLIEILPRQDRRNLLAVCEPVELVMSAVLCEPGQPTRHAYFPTHSFVSLLTLVDEKSTLEVGMVGREGMLGVQLALGATITPLRGLVQGSGEAWRITADALRKQLALSAALRRNIQLYVYVLMKQFASSAACVRFHQIDQRLARWLLMTQDRAHADDFHVTHEFLAFMLGVRRVGVTSAAGVLQRRGLIEYRRGAVTVVDRSGLEAAACSCYATDRSAYKRWLS